MQPGYGIDRQTDDHVNVFALGCIEPVRLVRLAVLQAMQVTLNFLN
jgi:hypothetical protein